MPTIIDVYYSIPDTQERWIAISAAGTVREVKAPSRDAALKLLRWNWPDEKWSFGRIELKIEP